MSDRTDTAENETRSRISEALKRAENRLALRGRSEIDAARAWVNAGFDDAEEVEEWIAARCFDERVAAALDTAGLTAAQASLRTREGRSDYEDTIAYKVSNKDLSIDEARRIITHEFWHN